MYANTKLVPKRIKLVKDLVEKRKIEFKGKDLSRKRDILGTDQRREKTKTLAKCSVLFAPD